MGWLQDSCRLTAGRGKLTCRVAVDRSFYPLPGESVTWHVWTVSYGMRGRRSEEMGGVGRGRAKRNWRDETEPLTRWVNKL